MWISALKGSQLYRQKGGKLFLPIAFRVIDSSAFRDMIKALKPAYSDNFLYHSDKLRTTMLDERYEELKKKLLVQVEMAPHFVLVMDWWESADGRHFVNVNVHTPLNPHFFWRLIDTSAISLNKFAVANILKEVANALGFEKWIGAVLDNASVNVTAENSIEEEFPYVFIDGCAVHNLNLLMEMIFKEESFRVAREKCIEIVKLIQNHQHARH